MIFGWISCFIGGYCNKITSFRIIDICLYRCDDSKYITGQTIMVDGGNVMRP